LSADLVRDGTRLGVAEMLRAGITCFADLSLFPEEAARAAAAAHMRAAIGLPVADAPTPWAESATAHLARAARVWDEYASDSRISLYFAPLAVHGMSEALLGRVRRVADELDARVAVHLAELAGAAQSADGAVLAAGALDLLAEARAAALHSGLTAGEVLRMATLGGATVLGLSAQIGSIEPGKAADLVCIDLGALGGQPAAAIADAITFGATRSQVSDVWTGGRLAVSGARLVALDEEELAALPARWAQRVRMEAAA